MGMKTQKEIFKSLVTEEKPDTVSINRERITNRARLRESQQIALKVLDKLNELNWSQRKLAREMGVSPQQITKIVKGTENLTLATQVKLQEVLDIPILATYYERKNENISKTIKLKHSDTYTLPEFNPKQDEAILLSRPKIEMKINPVSESYKTYSMPA